VGSIAVAVQALPALRLEPGCPLRVTVMPGQPVTVVVAVASREPLVHVDPDAAWTRSARRRAPLAGMEQ